MASDHYYDPEENGLEYVISKIVDEDLYNIETMSLMIVLPELALTDKIEDEQESLIKQEYMQREISQNIYIPVPDAPDDTENSFEDLNLFSLGNDRRSLTRKALKNVILHKLAAAAFEPRISQIGEMYRVFKLCNLLAMWISTYTTLLTSTDVNNSIDRICILNDESNQVTKYRSIEGTYYQVDEVIVDVPLISLEQLLMDSE
ncbi:uncharacterized protein LOC126847820 isoform X2 [Adelges cooleyi]|nr:uncharacterized protein LOC126847820 isoform X2 [Adelges cooleyi]